jgi:3'(2'), 5'-bisphosphate nucleotidase
VLTSQAPAIAEIVAIARAAGEVILEVYNSGSVVAASKSDSSPLTEADLRAHHLIVSRLAGLQPALPVLSEEASELSYATRAAWTRYWLIDPLDGTREFLSRNGEFTVNIALIDGNRAVLGVVHVPVSGITYWGSAGQGAWRAQAGTEPRRIQVQAELGARVRVAGSRSHRGDSLDRFLGQIGAHDFVSMGSSLKFCLVAEGQADVYPRLGPTSEWDTAAAQAVVEAAGGAVLTLDGTQLRYNTKAEYLNPYFVAFGSRQRDWIALLR